MAKYNPNSPSLFLTGGSVAGAPSGVDKYGISDNTGLGPNGLDRYRSYRITISGISPQIVGDENIRSGAARSYTGLDVKVGDWISNIKGDVILVIRSIESKGDSSLVCVVEDVSMINAKNSPTANNSFIDSEDVFIFETNDNDRPIFTGNVTDSFFQSNPTTLSKVSGFFNIFDSLYAKLLYDDPAPNISVGDLLTVTSSGKYSKAAEGDTIIGQVSVIADDPRYFYLRPFTKVIENYSDPQGITAGSPGTIYYVDPGASGSISTSGSKPVFIKITGSSPSFVIGTTGANLTASQALLINGVTGASGPANQASFINQINSGTSQHFVTASLYSSEAFTLSSDEALVFSDVIVPDQPTNSGNAVQITITDGVNTATATFSGTGNIAFPSGSINAFAAQDTINGSGIASILNSAFSSATPSAIDATASADPSYTNGSSPSTFNGLKIESNVPGVTLTINTVVQGFSNDFSGPGSLTGVKTSISPDISNVTRLERADGGEILLQGTYANQDGYYSVANGSVPTLVLLDPNAASSGGSNITFEPNSGLTFATGATAQTIYNTSISPTLAMPDAVGGIPAGTTAGALNTLNMVQLFDDILFPTVDPTYTIPTITLSSSITGIREIGSSYTANLSSVGTENDAGPFTQISVTKNVNSGGEGDIGVTGSPAQSSATDIAPQFGYADPNNPNNKYTYSLSDSGNIPSPSTGNSSSIVYKSYGNYDAGLAKKDNKGNDDDRSFAVRSINAPQSASTNFGSSTRTITGYYPYYYGVSNSQLTASQIETLIETGTEGVDFTKVVANSGGTLSMNFNAVGQYPWFAIYSGYGLKTAWYETGLNNGDIGLAPDNLFLAPSSLSVASQDGYWTVNYNIYPPGKVTTIGTAQIS